MFNDLKEIANLLDDTIAKGEALEPKRGVERFEEQIQKALTFDPFRPHEMTMDSGYYNPYRYVPGTNGGYLPYPVEHWVDQGKSADDYWMVKELYSNISPVAKAMGALKDLEKSLGVDLIKAGVVPIGTVHTYADGFRYKKVDEGKWVPVGAEKGKMAKYLVHPKQAYKDQAHGLIEDHAQKVQNINDVIERKQREQKTVQTAKQEAMKEALGHIRTVLSKLYEGGKLPEDVEANLKDALREQGLSEGLKQKIRRRPSGQGQEVRLKKDELEEILKGGKFALISAGKNPNHPTDQNLSDEDVKKRYNELHKGLREAGYAFTRVTGHYGGVEDSFLVMVHEADKKHIAELGKKLNQDSIIFAEGGKQEMHYTTGDKAGTHHKGEGLDPKAEEAKDYYSEIETTDGGKVKFSLNFDFSQVHKGDEKQKVNPNKELKGAEKQLKDKKHHVSVKFKHGDKEYSRTFKNVSSSGHTDAANKVQDLLKKLLPGHQLMGIHTEAAGRESKSKGEGGQSGGGQSQSGGGDDQGKKPKASGDQGKPDNEMGPPPPEREAFVKPGKEVSKEDTEKFIEEFHKDFIAMESVGSELKKSGASHFGNRLKDGASLLAKMKGRLSDRSLNTVTDVIGARALAKTIDDQKKLIDHIKKTHDVVEHVDYVSKPKAGYRAHHFLIRTESGKIGELQVKTLRQQVFSGFTHDTVYKPPKSASPEDLKALKAPEVQAYIDKVSDHVFKLDQGQEPGERPEPPEVMKKLGMNFPWEDIDKINRGETSSFDIQEKEGQKKFEEFKYFVTKRDEDKKNLGTKEFGSFDKAKDYRDSERQSGHKGELPIGQGHSKEEYLTTFSEYRDTPKKGG